MSWGVIQELGGKQLLVQLKGKVKIGKQIVNLSGGIEYYKVYKVQGGLPQLATSEMSSVEGPVVGNNKDYFDDNTAQSLDQEAILKIREQQGGDVLIDQLVQNSSTFAMKTQFSQEKYLKKKKNKHLSLFRVLQATAGNIADTLYINKPTRGIKSDALFNILTLANIHYFSKVLVNDFTGGVILGSVLERSSLPVTNIYTDKFKDHALKYFGIAKKTTPQLEYRQIDSITDFYDSMILAEKSGILETFQKMLSKLKGSGTFVMYSQDIVSAGEIYDWIMTEGVAANVIFEEIWTREFQVLPQRTHPDMKLRTGTSGGYLVSGIKLHN
ncbi:hypothetical protein SteCoe_6812 [Stentor coeruleus]|uniref:tRNA (adenine(58)-N(1))-methyltransferase non-catalytic subunit TRM6 n=1 Tax=Stentor coeruleus TaxID=5963 RepID=A0A1R2CP12_9CILI|nr:hypothetical protein SteCoe_6812 [Stentor coeruleus]